MEKRILGKELEVSAIGLGCMTIGKDYSDESRAQAIEFIHRAYDHGQYAARDQKSGGRFLKASADRSY